MCSLASTAARLVAAAVLLGLPLTIGATPAAATSPWTPYRAADFVVPAGDRCSFELRGEVVSDKERIRTLDTYSDGSPRVQQVVGQLVVRYTNTATGRSVVRNLTGNALIDYGTDGSFTLILKGGHFAAGLQPTDVGGPAFLVFTGSGHTLHIAANGSRTVTFGHGPVEDICQTLAG